MFQPRAALWNSPGCRQQPPKPAFWGRPCRGTFDVFCRPQSAHPRSSRIHKLRRTRAHQWCCHPCKISWSYDVFKAFAQRRPKLLHAPDIAKKCRLIASRLKSDPVDAYFGSGPDHAKWRSFAMRVQLLAAVAPQLALQRQHRHTHDFSEREASVWGRQRGCTHPKLGFMSISTLQAF